MIYLAPMRHAAARFAPLVIGVIAAALLMLTPEIALGQRGDDPGSKEQADEIEQVLGLELDPELPNFDLIDPEWLDAEWVDPIDRFELADEPLAPAPSFDFWTLHPSNVFETGIANLEVAHPPDLTTEKDNHTRALQVVATGELAWDTAGQDITDTRVEIDTANSAIATNNSEIDRIQDELAVQLGRLDDIAITDSEEVVEQAELNAENAKSNGVIIELAVQAFTGENNDLETLFEDPYSTAPIERRVVTAQLREFQFAEIESRENLIRESEGRRSVLAEQRATIEAANRVRLSRVESLNQENGALRRLISDARGDISALEERRVELEETIEVAGAFSEVTALHYQAAYHQRLSLFVSGTNIPLVALNAYARAASTLAEEDRGCGIHWSQLAGIGHIESGHGYFGDSTLDVNGNTTVDIQGLALDGRVLSGSPNGDLPDATGRTEETRGVMRLALILDTDKGVLDGDSVYDRAVGPMQFIPTTWRLFTPDGNGDGQSDPQNVYDAALAAARYLCDAPGSMLTHEGEQRAYFAYNHDLAYSRNVTRTGRRYHKLLDVSPESSAFAAHAFTPTPEEQEAIDKAEAAAAVKEEFVTAAADKAVQAATAECEAQAATDAQAAAAPEPDTPVDETVTDATADAPTDEESAAAIDDEPVDVDGTDAGEPVDCSAVGEAVRDAAKEAAALAYVEPADGEANE